MTDADNIDLSAAVKAVIPPEFSYVLVLYPLGPSTTDGDVITEQVSADQLHLAAQSLEALHQFARRQEIETAMKNQIATPDNGGLIIPGKRGHNRGR